MLQTKKIKNIANDSMNAPKVFMAPPSREDLSCIRYYFTY